VLVHNEATSRKHLALEVIVTLAENASGMVRKNASKYIPLIVPQILAMMVDLEDDPEWSIQDEIEDEDEERLDFINLNRFCFILNKVN
jgi:hypothetical protein